MAGAVSFLLGIRAQQPREYVRLLRLRSRIYTTVARLEATALRSAEPIPFAELDREAFRPIRPGQSWGATLDCAWLHITGRVPDGVENPVVLLGIRGEGLVCSPDGEPLDAVSTVFQQADLPHSAGRYRPVHNVPVADGRIEFYADVAHNGVILYPVGRGVYHGARIATRDETAFGLYYDYLTLVVLAGATDDPALESQLRAALAEAWRRFRSGDLAAARAGLAPSLAAPSSSAFVYSAIGHSHLDMAWLWPLRETRRKAARTYARALDLLDRHPDYRYGTSQPQQLAWMKQQQPHLFARIQRAVADGRMELQGSFWVETDTNLPSGESLVRQVLVGRRFLQEEFGLGDEQLRLCWLPDTFGYSGNLPQLLTKSGMDWFLTIKLAWNKVNTFPHRTFHWQGIDGSSVLVHMPPEGDYNSRAAADGLLAGLRRYPERALDTALLVYGSGDGGGGPGEIHLELTDRERGVDGHGLRGLPRLERSTASDFFRHLETLEVPHTHRGELYLEAHQGTYTTQGAIKKHNRVVERMLHEVEALSVLAGRDTRARLEPLWRSVLLHQFHDIIPGSSITRVNREAVAAYEHLEGELDTVGGELVAALPAADGPTAVNLTSFPRDEHVRVGNTWHRAVVDPYAAAATEQVDGPFGLAAVGDLISNRLITLRFGQGGEIVSCRDAAGGEHAGGGLNRLVLHRDPYQWPFDAWDIDARYTARAPRRLRLVASENRIDGPTVTRIQTLRGPKVEVEQHIVLETGSPLVRIRNRVVWRASHRMLRAEFRPTHYGDEALCEIQFGHIARTTTERDPIETAQFEVCAHKWAAVSDADGGFALLNDAKYGHRIKSGLISLNLLRAPTFPDRSADRGEHRFTYAFLPFAAGDLAAVVREGYRLNNPLRITTAAPFASAVSTSDPGVVVETVKRSDDGRGTVIRLYESLGRATTTALRTTLPHGAAQRTDLLERPVGDAALGALELGPFEIVTILLHDA